MSHFDTTILFEAEERGFLAAADDWSVSVTSIKCSRFWIRADTDRGGQISDLATGQYELGDTALALRLCLKLAGYPARGGIRLSERVAETEFVRQLASEIARQERIFLKDISQQNGEYLVTFD